MNRKHYFWCIFIVSVIVRRMFDLVSNRFKGKSNISSFLFFFFFFGKQMFSLYTNTEGPKRSYSIQNQILQFLKLNQMQIIFPKKNFTFTQKKSIYIYFSAVVSLIFRRYIFLSSYNYQREFDINSIHEGKKKY